MHSIDGRKSKMCDFCKVNIGNDDWEVTFLAGCDHVFHVNCLSNGDLCPACELNFCRRVQDDFKSVIASMMLFLEDFEVRIDPMIAREGLGQAGRHQLKFLKLKMAELKTTVETYESKADLCKWCEDVSPNSCIQFKHALSKRVELQTYIHEITTILLQLTSVIRALGSAIAA